MKIIIEQKPVRLNEVAKAQIEKEIDFIQSNALAAQLESLKLQQEINENPEKKEENSRKIQELLGQLSLWKFNLAMVNSRLQHYESDKLEPVIKEIQYCCGKLEEEHKDGELFYFSQKEGAVYLRKNEDSPSISFCPFCGEYIWTNLQG